MLTKKLTDCYHVNAWVHTVASGEE